MFMLKPVTITTTLDPNMNNWLKEEAKRQNTTKRVIIEKALNNYILEQKKQLYAEAFKTMADDPEMLWLAEAGLGDYLDMIKNHEKCYES